jgi:hypothetical protein
VHVVKTLSEAEHAFLLRCLPSYSTHMTTHSESTLLPRFFGLYCVKLPSKVRLLGTHGKWRKYCLPGTKNVGSLGF